MKKVAHMTLHRSLSSPLEPPNSYIPASRFDILIPDITETDYELLAGETGVRRLSISDTEGSFPVNGILYGRNFRVFIPLVVSKQRSKLNILFFVDTGSPITFLRHETLAALGFTEAIPAETIVSINGVNLTVSVSHAHFNNVDLLGQDFFRAANAVLTIDYKALEVRIA
jgi:hypothetical protein